MIAVSDADVVVFVLAGCNAAEIAAYAGIDEQTAKARICHARVDLARHGAPADGRRRDVTGGDR